MMEFFEVKSDRFKGYVGDFKKGQKLLYDYIGDNEVYVKFGYKGVLMLFVEEVVQE